MANGSGSLVSLPLCIPPRSVRIASRPLVSLTSPLVSGTASLPPTGRERILKGESGTVHDRPVLPRYGTLLTKNA